jgi:serine/threonine protein phosphatase PrpC
MLAPRFSTAAVTVGCTGQGQDRVAIFPFGASVIIAVADGSGGTSGGAEAADSVIQMVGRRVQDSPDDVANSDGNDWCDVLRAIDRGLSRSHGGQTTAVLIIVSSEAIVGATVGDSDAWIITSERHEILTSESLRKPLLGSGAAVPVSFASKGALDGTLLVATDGLLKYARADRIAAAARGSDLDQAMRDLVDFGSAPELCKMILGSCFVAPRTRDPFIGSALDLD